MIERVRDLMSDGVRRSTNDVIAYIFPDIEYWDYSSKQAQVYHCLSMLAKYDIIKKEYVRKGNTTYWQYK